MLKSDFHIHTREDPHDKISYSSKELISHAAKLGFEVLAITNHHKIHYNKDLAGYAKRKGILLIPGVETHINRKEVLLLNVKKPGTLNNFSDLEKLKNENVVIIAPHPFYLTSACLGKKLIENIQYFDGIEYTHFYFNNFNLFNQKAIKIAKQYNKTMVGTSDSHKSYQFGYTYSLVDCNKDIESVLEAIRKGKVQVQTRRLPLLPLSKVFFTVIFSGVNRKVKNIQFDNSYC